MCSRIRFIQSGSFRRNTCFASPSPCQKHPYLALPTVRRSPDRALHIDRRSPPLSKNRQDYMYIGTRCQAAPHSGVGVSPAAVSASAQFPGLSPRVPSSDGIPQSCGTCRGVSAVPRRSSPKLSARPFPPFPPVAAGADRGSFILPNLRSYALSPGLAGSRL
jgi:hypothetical protein